MRKFLVLLALCAATFGTAGCGDNSPENPEEGKNTAVEALIMPMDGSIYNLSSSTTRVSFQWSKVSTASATYAVLFSPTSDGFSSPAESIDAGNSNSLVLDAAGMKEIARACGIDYHQTGNVYWTVSVTVDGVTALCKTSRRMSITMPGPDPTAEAFNPNPDLDLSGGWDGINVPESGWSWAQAADSCTFILTNSFMNTNTGIWWGSRQNIAGGNGNNYWGQAYPWQTLLYSHDRIKDSNPSLAATYKNWFTKWVSNNGNNYNGVKKNGFYCQYTDDMAWICLVLIHAYDVWGDANHLTKAKEIYGYMTEPERIYSDAEGWGLIWRRSNEDITDGVQKDTRNACTNTPAMIIACELYRITQEQKYLDDAKQLYDFMTYSGTRAKANGAVGGTPLTYTQGCWIEACRLLYGLTGESKYMESSSTCLVFTMESGRCTTKYTYPDGNQYGFPSGFQTNVLRSEGTDGDQRNFKGGFMPYIANYILDTSMPFETRRKAYTFLLRNAQILWFDHMNRAEYPLMFANYYFGKFYDEDKELGGTTYHNLGWCGMHNCGAAMLEAMARLPKTLQ